MESNNLSIYDEDYLKSKISTSKPEKRGGRQYLPYVFTEQGIYMLMTVLKGDLAVDQSKKLIKLFKKMKDFFSVSKRIYHDRYIFIDSGTKNEMVFHCGGSSKDGGRRVTSITKVEDVMLYQNIIGTLNTQL